LDFEGNFMRCGTLISADWKGSNMSGDGRFQGEDERYWVEASSAERKKKERIFRVSFCFEGDLDQNTRAELSTTRCQRGLGFAAPCRAKNRVTSDRDVGCNWQGCSLCSGISFQIGCA
jgi:hypothetical protein